MQLSAHELLILIRGLNDEKEDLSESVDRLRRNVEQLNLDIDRNIVKLFEYISLLEDRINELKHSEHSEQFDVKFDIPESEFPFQ